MSKLQEISRSRNWHKGRLKGIQSNLKNASHGPELTYKERVLLKDAIRFIDQVLDGWEEQYQKLKQEIEDEQTS